MVQKPREGQADQRAASAVRDFLEPVDGVKGARVPVSILIHSIPIESSAFWNPRFRVLARQQSSSQRIVGECADTVYLCHRQELLLEAPRQQVIHGLRNISRRIVL